MSQVEAFPEVRGHFERIMAYGQRIVLSSSSHAEEVESRKTTAEIDDLINDTTSAEDAERSMPFPDIFEAAFANLGLNQRAKSMVVGDTPYVAEAARAARLATIRFLCAGFTEQALRKAGCLTVHCGPQHPLDAFDESPLAEALGSV